MPHYVKHLHNISHVVMEYLLTYIAGRLKILLCVRRHFILNRDHSALLQFTFSSILHDIRNMDDKFYILALEDAP